MDTLASKAVTQYEKEIKDFEEKSTTSPFDTQFPTNSNDFGIGEPELNPIERMDATYGESPNKLTFGFVLIQAGKTLSSIKNFFGSKEENLGLELNQDSGELV